MGFHVADHLRGKFSLLVEVDIKGEAMAVILAGILAVCATAWDVSVPVTAQSSGVAHMVASESAREIFSGAFEFALRHEESVIILLA